MTHNLENLIWNIKTNKPEPVNALKISEISFDNLINEHSFDGIDT